MCARLKKGAGKERYCHGRRRIPPIIRTRGGFSPVPENRPRKFGETLFSSDKLCRATARKTGRLPARTQGCSRLPTSIRPTCANIRFLGNTVDPVLINQARGTDSLPVHHRCHRRRSCNCLFVRVTVTRFQIRTPVPFTPEHVLPDRGGWERRGGR